MRPSCGLRQIGTFRPLRVALLLAAGTALFALGRAPVEAGRVQSGGMEVLSYTPGRIELGGSPFVIVRGVLRNDTGVVATDVQITLRIRRSPGGELLAEPS